MRTTVVIPTHRRNDLLKRTLESVAACRLPEGFDQTIVVENGGQHGAEEVVRNAPVEARASYLYHEQGNKSEALNKVLERIDDGLFVFLDDDVRLDPGVIETYAQAAGENPGFFYGGPTSVDYEATPPAWLTPYLPASARGWEFDGEGDVVSAPLMLGFNWAARARDLIEAGGFDASRGPGSPFGATGQESQMQRVLLARGILGKYLPSARVWHYVPADRCSIEWVINRKFRTGVQQGMNLNPAHGALLGVPNWAVKRWLIANAKRVFSKLQRDPRARLDAELNLQQIKGYLSGVRAARKLRSTTQQAGRSSVT
jgi:glycosyltransferase involved in cell wall biosynthesis